MTYRKISEEQTQQLINHLGNGIAKFVNPVINILFELEVIKEEGE
jgi:hypothetical protein